MVGVAVDSVGLETYDLRGRASGDRWEKGGGVVI